MVCGRRWPGFLEKTLHAVTCLRGLLQTDRAGWMDVNCTKHFLTFGRVFRSWSPGPVGSGTYIHSAVRSLPTSQFHLAPPFHQGVCVEITHRVHLQIVLPVGEFHFLFLDGQVDSESGDPLERGKSTSVTFRLYKWKLDRVFLKTGAKEIVCCFLEKGGK